jgi:glycosyltransferase involved in cell wall biosynthesis
VSTITISVYTTTFNALREEYCVIEGIKSALQFADEVVVLDSHSTDGTVDAIKAIGDDRIKIYYIDWLNSIGWAMYKIAKSMALGRCTKDWCVLMDADEVFHDKDLWDIHQLPFLANDKINAFRFNTLHFYKDYDHLLNGNPRWKDLYTKKVYMVRNGLGIHHGNSGMDIDAHLDRYGIPLKEESIMDTGINVYHYGHVRSDQAYLEKQNRMHSYYEGKEINRTKIDWIDTNDLKRFEGLHPSFMKDKIKKYRRSIPVVV